MSEFDDQSMPRGIFAAFKRQGGFAAGSELEAEFRKFKAQVQTQYQAILNDYLDYNNRLKAFDELTRQLQDTVASLIEIDDALSARLQALEERVEALAKPKKA